MNVLYIENNSTDVNLLKQTLSRTAPQITVEWVTSRKEALAKLEASTPGRPLYDVLLTDMELPDGEGLSLIPYLHENNLPIAVVILTGHSNEKSAIQAFRLGAIDYVIKHPGYLQELTGVLENAFHRSLSAREQKILKANEEYFRSLIENSSDIIMVIDKNGAIKYASPSYERSLAFTPEEITETEAFSFIHPDDQSTASYAVTETLAHPGVTGPTIELRIRHKGGSWRYMEVIGKGLKDPSGQPIIAVNMRDITERKEAEEKLFESEERYRAAIEYSNDGVALVRGNKHIYVNQKFLDIFGYDKPEEILGTTTYITAHPDDRQMMIEYNQKRQRGEAVPSQYTFKGIKKDGTLLYIHISVAIMCLRGKSVTLAFLRDITEHRLAEQKIIESKQSLQTIITASPIGIGRVRNRVIDWVNESMCRISGYTFEELEGKSTRILHESDEAFDAVGKALNKAGQAEHRLMRKDGTMRDVFVQISPTNNPSHIFTVTDITQQKEAERALRKSDVLFRSLVEKSSEILMLGNAERKRLYVSPNITKILGYTLEEFLAGNRADFIHPDSVYPGESARSWVLEHPGEAVTFETMNRHKDGSWRWFECTARNLLEEPNVNAMVMNLRDITERKEAEETLKASEERSRALVEKSSEVILLIDTDVKRTYVSQAVTNILGYSPEEFLTQSGDGAIHPGDRAALKAARLQADEHPGETIISICRRKHKDGSWRWTENTTRNLLHDPNIRAHVINFHDITDRKNAEEALFESEAKYRMVVENSLVGFYIIQDNLFRFVNKRFCEIFGYTYEEVVNKISPIDSAHPEDRKMVEENIQKRLTGQVDDIEYEFRGLKKDGNAINVKVLGSSKMYNGRPAITGTIIDITREQTLESQLRQAQKMEAIGTLAGGVAHDFNNILTALTGYGTLLQLKLDKENPLRHYVDQILSASMKGANLTRSLLAFSRKQPIILNPVNLSNIVKGTEKLLRRLLTEDIIMKTFLTLDDSMIMADPTQIDQILFNMVTNARDAMPKGGSLTIETRAVMLDKEFVKIHGFGSPGKYALLSISDTGVGMDTAVKEHIFDPFFTTKEVGRGTGLGLSTIYGIVKQHNGYITLYSEPGTGTTFRIYFPITSTSVEADRSSSESVRGGTETILVAEDNKEVRHLIKNILVEFGYTIIEAKDGEDAINKFNKQRTVDLLILDSVMPKKNGKAVYDEISATHPNVKVIFTSGYTRDVILDKGIEDKRFNFIAKPLSPKELLIKVREVLDR